VRDVKALNLSPGFADICLIGFEHKNSILPPTDALAHNVTLIIDTDQR